LAVIFEGNAAAEVGELSVVFARRSVVGDRFGKSTRSVKADRNYVAI
jgi:hypothetical protein